MTPTVCLLLKAPRPGFVKTRLAARIGPIRASRIYRQLVERQIAAIPNSWESAVAFAPEDAHGEMQAWLGSGLRLFPQCSGSLGDRLDQATRTVSPRPGTPVLLVGGDCPELSTDRLRAAAASLDASDAVIWPAVDGGYVLLGLNRHVPGIFDNIGWSTPKVFEESLARMKDSGLRVDVQNPPLSDVDEFGDWERYLALS